MIHLARFQIGLTKNSKLSSQRNRLVKRSSEPFAVTRESHILTLCSTAERPAQPTKLNPTITRSFALSLAPRLIKQNP